jgi:hypothetical protein
MEIAPPAPETCAICGDPLDVDRAFARFYEDGGRRSFCSPSCASQYLHRPTVDADGTGSIDERIEHLRWRNGGS